MVDSRLFVLFALVAAGCGESRPESALATGEYGGEHVALSVGASSARLEFDCAHGQMPAPIHLDSEGRFSVEGTFTQERGGPATTLPEDVRPVRYTGVSRGSEVTFTIRLIREDGSLGSFSVRRGSPASLFRCLLVGPGA
jgi:hypothetical protein